jgi:phosphoesterase RecJ-like protein
MSKNLTHHDIDPRVLQLIHDLILPAERILLVTHVAPDGDAIGSLLGLGWLLRAQRKQLTMACADPVPEIYDWLPGSDEVVRQGSGRYDLVISLDCSDQRRMGWAYEDRMAAAPLLNIDHHVTNTRFGTVNWVDPSSAATAQMLLNLADALGWELTRPIAVCLLNGLVTDTRSFRTSNVDIAAFQAALQLMEAGASLSEITRRALEQRPLASVRLWGQAIDGLHLQDGVLWTEVTHAMRQYWALGEDGDSGLTNFLSGVREASVVVVFTERKNGTVDVGMRAVPGYDVAQVALRLGGGGHPLAAGCTLEGDLVQVRQQVLAEVQRSLEDQRMEGHDRAWTSSSAETGPRGF